MVASGGEVLFGSHSWLRSGTVVAQLSMHPKSVNIALNVYICASVATCPPPNLLTIEVGAGTCLAWGTGRCTNQTLHVAKHGTAPTFDV